MVAAPIVAAGLYAAAGLFQQMQQRKMAEEQMRQQRLQNDLNFRRQRQMQAERDHLDTIASMGSSEQNALQNMIAALSRTAG